MQNLFEKFSVLSPVDFQAVFNGLQIGYYRWVQRSEDESLLK